MKRGPVLGKSVGFANFDWTACDGSGTVSLVVHGVPVDDQSTRESGLTEKEGTSQEGRTFSPGSRVRSAVRTANDVKCPPSRGGLSDTGHRVVRLREPRGAGELRLTGHSGFSALKPFSGGKRHFHGDHQRDNRDASSYW